MKKISLLFVVFLLTGILFTSGSASAQNGNAKWTYLVYLIGSDLESEYNAGSDDLDEMMKVGSTENMNVIVTTGGAKKNGSAKGEINWQKISRWKAMKGGLTSIPFSPQNNDMATPENLTDFITWGVQTFPAEKYVLILWDHGAALDGYGNDENSGNKFSVMQLKESLQRAYAVTQKKFEILGFDACLMANLEVLANYKSFSNYFVASEELEPGHGWDYTAILNAMASNSVTDGASLGKVIAASYLQHGLSNETSGITLSVINTAKVDNVIAALNKFSTDIMANTEPGKGATYIPVSKGRSKAEEYGKSDEDPGESSDVVDIADFANQVKANNPALAASADALIRSIKEAVVYKVKDKTRPNANGLSMFFPYYKLKNKAGIKTVMAEYSKIPFSPTYLKFLNVYTGLAAADVTKPEVPQGVTDHDNIVEAVCTSEDFDEAFVVLIAPDEKDENVITFLGVMLPDEVAETDDGVSIKYNWDGQWIGLNGEPANISDMYETEYEDEDGNTVKLTLLEIPAKINDEYVILEFTVDEDGSYELSNIMPEADESGLFPKKTITIEPGDKMTLLYNKYDMTTDEEFEEEGETFTLNSEDDIQLSIIKLKAGDYLIGYAIYDCNRNEDFFLNDNVFTIKP